MRKLRDPSDRILEAPDNGPSEDHQRGVELIRRGIGYGRVRQLEKAILCLLEGLRLIDERRDPRLNLSAHHNLALFFAHVGLPVVARGILVRVQKLYGAIEDPVIRARLLWLLGTIARFSGNPERAKERMWQAIEVFREAGLEDQVSTVEAELAEIEEGEHGDSEASGPAFGAYDATEDD